MLTRKLFMPVCLSAIIASMSCAVAMAQAPVSAPQTVVKTVEVSPANPDLAVGQ